MAELNPKEYLHPYKNSGVDFFRFPGNYGDSLIWHGTKVLLSEFNISVQYVDITSVKYNPVLLIDGGGNLVDLYSDVKDFLIKKPSLYDEIIILPHTIFGERQIEVLNKVSSKLIVFCRERVSEEFLEKRLNSRKVYLWHDCAFYNIFLRASSGSGILNAFRSDKESILHDVPKPNIDLSHNGYAKKPLNSLMEVLQKYKEIHTDRLHIAIAGALLGKQVRLFPNSYYKNKAVFDYSLKRFPNVRFVENFNESQHAQL